MQTFSEKLVGLGKDRYLTLFGHVDLTLNAYQVADVKVLPCLVFLFGKVVDLCEDLDLAPSVVKVAERYLAHAALGHKTSCNSDCLSCERLVVAGDLNRVVCYVVCEFFVGILAFSLEGLELFNTETCLFLDLFCT